MSTESKAAPPRFSARILRRVASAEARPEVEGDLLEAFERWASSKGTGFARRRYRREVAMMAWWRMVGWWRRLRDGSQRAGGGAPTHAAAGQDPRRGGPGYLVTDIRYGLRRLVQSPLSTTVAILLLAVGIGGNATVFTVVEKIFVEPPPLVQDPHELVGLDWVLGGQNSAEFGYYDYEFYRDNGEAFADVLAYGGFPGSRGRRTDGGGGEVVVGRGEGVEQAGAWVVTGNYFRLLGVSMALGAGFSQEMDVRGAAQPEVILSHDYWARRFGSDPSLLEQPLFLNGVAFRVAGITPRAFKGINPGEPLPDLFVPVLYAEHISLGFDAQLRRYQEDGTPSASRFLRLVARLQPGYTVEGAQAEAAVLQARWETQFTDWAMAAYGATYRLQVRPEFHLAPFEARGLRRMLFYLWFVVGAVFLIGCTNLANLLLASSSGREQEMGIRSSLGANQGRLLAQLLTESLVLAALGGAAGLGVAYAGGNAIVAILPMNFEGGFTPDGSVILFAFLLSALAAVLFGTAPAWKLSRIDVRTLIQRPGHLRTRTLFRGGLVAGQSALSILLLIGGGLLARSVQQIQRIDLGFDPDRRLLMSLQLDNHGYSDEDGQEFVLGALDRLVQVPGVISASVSNRVPFLGSNTFTITAPGTDFAQQGLRLGLNLVGPEYFEAMGIPMLAGREFTKDDVAGTPWVAVVNETLAQRVWPNENPLGKTVDILDQSARVVGVAQTSVYYNVTESPRSHIYFPSLQLYQGMMSFVVATDPPTTTMIGPVDQALRELNPNLAIAPMTLEGLVENQVSAFRTWTTVVGIVAAIALFLALVGMYGVQSYLVSRRTREIGLRMALGAQAQTLVGGVVKSSLIMGGVGALVGVGGALALSRLMRGFLFGVGPNDPQVFLTVPLLLLAACVVASLVPALRASRVNPVEALRKE